MGYCSKVALACESKAEDKLKEALDNLELPDKSYKVKGGGTIFYWRWVKWYGEDVDELESVLDSLQDDEFDNTEGYGYRLIRIGEEMGDYDMQSNTGGDDAFGSLYYYQEIHMPNADETDE